MKGIKYLLFGLMFILIGGFILVDAESGLGGFGEVTLFTIGIILGAKGLNEEQ